MSKFTEDLTQYMNSPIVDAQDLGTRVHLIRHARKLSSREVAKELGMNRTTLLRIQNGMEPRYTRGKMIEKWIQKELVKLNESPQVQNLPR